MQISGRIAKQLQLPASAPVPDYAGLSIQTYQQHHFTHHFACRRRPALLCTGRTKLLGG